MNGAFPLNRTAGMVRVGLRGNPGAELPNQVSRGSQRSAYHEVPTESKGNLSAAATRMIPFQGDWTSEMDAPPGVQPNYGGDRILTGMNAVSSGWCPWESGWAWWKR